MQFNNPKVLTNKPLQNLFGSIKKPNRGSENFGRGPGKLSGGSENFGGGSENFGGGSGNLGGGSGKLAGGSGKIVEGSGKFAGGVFYSTEIFGHLSGLHGDKVPELRTNKSSPTSLDFLKYFNFRKAKDQL